VFSSFLEGVAVPLPLVLGECEDAGEIVVAVGLV